MIKPVSYNVAYAGSHEDIELGVHYRNQWTGLSGRTISNGSFDFNMPITKIHAGIMMNMMYDVLGLQRNLYMSLGFAYQLQIKKAKIGIGVAGGIIQTTLLGNLLRAPEGEYESTIDHRDPILPLDKASGIAPYLNAGLWFSYKELQLGVSTTSVLEGSTKLTNPSDQVNIIFRRNYYGNISYKFKLTKSLNLTPNMLFKTDFKEHQMDLNLIFGIKGRFDLGIGYRGYSKKSNESIILLAGAKIWQGLRLFYSYDVSTGKLSPYTGGSHEISLTYKLNYKRKVVEPKVIYNPRFL